VLFLHNNKKDWRFVMPDTEYCCYLLGEQGGSRTYCGTTNNLARRLRQHNAEIAGGARYTRGRRWDCVCTVVGFPSHGAALSFEWWMKHGCGAQADGLPPLVDSPTGPAVCRPSARNPRVG
jgi:predicted GIY-YIG superfamily endonuclease